MNPIVRHVVLPSLAAITAHAAAHGAATRPNIILFMVDDMGWQDTSLPLTDSPTPNNRRFVTPNMERLAAQGMRFTQAYACSVSSPSRCSLLTGANSARHGVTNWTYGRDATNDEPCDSIRLPQWNYNGISRVRGINNTYVGPSFVQELKDAGYHTIHVGKAHFGAKDTPGEDPHHWGFEVNITGSAAGGLATYLSEQNYGHDSEGRPTSRFAIEGLEKYWGTGTFATEALTLEAIGALEKARLYNQPWFLYMAHYAVHIPIDRDMRFYDKYIARGYSEKEAAYASLVEGMDKSLGDLLDWVEERGEADNTIVIFMSDNGGLASSSQWRDGEPLTQNAPLRAGKGALYEGGIREPMIVSWPGRTTPGSRCDSYLIIEDFYPSILEMAGIDASSPVRYGHRIDGRSFVSLIDGAGDDPSAGRALIWNFPNCWGLHDLVCAIRKDDWKLIYSYADGHKELYNIKEDLGETTDLAAKHPERVRALSIELADSLRARGAMRPSFASDGRLCPWPDER